jgi:hypothetical protein
VLNGEVSSSERRQQAQKTTRKLAESGKLRFSGSLKVGLGNSWWGNLIVDSSVPDSGKRASLHRALSASRVVPAPPCRVQSACWGNEPCVLQGPFAVNCRSQSRRYTLTQYLMASGNHQKEARRNQQAFC